MAKFYAMRIIDGKTTFDKVPDALKDAVAKILIEKGHPEYITSTEGV